MSGIKQLRELGERIERRRRTHTEKLSQLAKDSEFDPPCEWDCSGWIHYDHDGEHLYGKCPLYEIEPPCLIPEARHGDVLWQMRRAGWPDRYVEAEWEKCDRAVEDALKTWLVRRDKEPRTTRQGLLLHGPVGTGKSSAMGCVGYNMTVHSSPPEFIRWGELGELLAYDNRDALHRLRGASVLALDDFGTGDHPQWLLNRFDALVEYRYSVGRPWLVTTNMSPQTMRQEADWQRFVDRWGETMFVVAMPGKSKRA